MSAPPSNPGTAGAPPVTPTSGAPASTSATDQALEARVAQLEQYVGQLWCCCCWLQEQLKQMGYPCLIGFILSVVVNPPVVYGGRSGQAPASRATVHLGKGAHSKSNQSPKSNATVTYGAPVIGTSNQTPLSVAVVTISMTLASESNNPVVSVATYSNATHFTASGQSGQAPGSTAAYP